MIMPNFTLSKSIYDEIKIINSKESFLATQNTMLFM
jgi:hypothetical protein